MRPERLRKEEELCHVGHDTVDLADDESEVSSAAVTLFVSSGIASADVICCARLGLFSQGEDHRQAINLLAQADVSSSPHLATLLELKTKAAYAHVRMSPVELVRASRAADHLLAATRRWGLTAS